MRATIFDYGAGNLHSLGKALVLAGAEVRIEPDPRKAADTDLLVLPGVGAFGSAAARLAPGRIAMRAAVERGLPCLGICLGMQLMFETSEEGPGSGLAIFPGFVARARANRVPHIGWNSLDDGSDPLLAQSSLEIAYFAHSYVCRPADTDIVAAWTTHETDRFAAVVRQGNIMGVQFHPEKSSTAGVRFLREFVEQVRQ